MSDTGDLDDLEGRLGELAREITEDDRRLDDPPPGLWDSIEAAAGGAELASVTSLSERRRTRAPMILAAAAAVILAVVIGTQLIGDNGDNGEVVASIALENDGLQVPNPDTGMADLVAVEGGGYVLDVSVPELPAADGFYELWIIDTNVEGMHSLGVVEASGRYQIPDGVEPADFPIVDISVEAHDGDATHGGQSIWRGVLEV
ncbi:MAG: anti-sigma factor [Acidimicrobiales bacterium]